MSRVSKRVLIGSVSIPRSAVEKLPVVRDLEAAQIGIPGFVITGAAVAEGRILVTAYPYEEWRAPSDWDRLEAHGYHLCWWTRQRGRRPSGHHAVLPVRRTISDGRIRP